MVYTRRGKSKYLYLNMLNKCILTKQTPVGMSSTLMHHDERIFPDSHKFIPERWLDLEQRKHLEKYMVAFTKGSRQCIGMKYASFHSLSILHTNSWAVSRGPKFSSPFPRSSEN